MLELDAVYRKVDEALAGFGCAVSGECCQLAVTGREPYLFELELVRLERALAAAGRPWPAPRPDGACPLLDASGKRCSVYADRPFGCRTFFCERIRGPRKYPTDAIRSLTARLTTVSDRVTPGAAPRLVRELLAERSQPSR